MSLQLRKYLSSRSRGHRLVFILGVFSLGYVYCFSTHFKKALTPFFSTNELALHADKDATVGRGCLHALPWAGRRLLAENVSSGSSSSYPTDLFTEEQRRQGAVILHISGMIYMFVALAIVCDEFFVPSLDVITEKLGVSEDVAGATFMAAGGSAPELFTSLIGVFISQSDVGIGTIVGSAVFNILFVIGMCALFSKTLLTLTWWPLFRDVSFYSTCLVILIAFFIDEEIQWWEALVLFVCYICYGLFMKWNVQFEICFKSFLRRCSCSKSKASVSDTEVNEPPAVVPTVTDMNYQEKHRLSRKLTSHRMSLAHFMHPHGGDKHQATALTKQSLKSDRSDEVDQPVKISAVDLVKPKDEPKDVECQELEEVLEEIDENEPLDLSWPPTTSKRLMYLLLAPIIFPLAFTLPDVRRPNRKVCFVWTFAGSIIWIAFFSYNMVWWANVSGVTIGIPDEVMGLTILAAGTSVPDLITSVIVARKGFGDMALSSSVGSNLFDITVGLPVPWLLYSAVNEGAPYKVSSKGLLCSIFLLFGMLVAVVICIAVSGWKMNKFLGFSMLFLYNIFIVIAVMLEYSILKCPNAAVDE